MIFDIPEHEVDNSKKADSKTINYSILYGAGPFRISQELKIPIKDASQIIKTILVVILKSRIILIIQFHLVKNMDL